MRNIEVDATREDRKSLPRMTGRSSLRILCADDDLLVADVLMLFLSKAGHCAEHVRDGLEAWEKLSANLSDFDLLITDHQLPGLTGLELAELLQEASYAGRVVVHTARLSEDETARYRHFAVAGIVVKSANLEELARTIKAGVER